MFDTVYAIVSFVRTMAQRRAIGGKETAVYTCIRIFEF